MPEDHGGYTTRRTVCLRTMVGILACTMVGIVPSWVCAGDGTMVRIVLPGYVENREDLCAKSLSLPYYMGIVPCAIRSLLTLTRRDGVIRA